MNEFPVFYVDFNDREVLPDGNQAVAIRTGSVNHRTLGDKLRTGLRVTIYDECVSWEGIVRESRQLHGWVADLVPGTSRNLAASDLEELEQLRQVPIRD